MEATQAIVLHSIQHKSSTRIVKVLTQQDEIIPLYISGFGKGKGNKKTAVFYPGNAIEFTIKNPHKSGLKNVLNEVIVESHSEIHASMVKSAILTMSLECLYKLIPQERKIEGLFEFYFNFLAYLNASEVFLNLPFLFLIRLSDFLGILPEPGTGYFNIREGEFESNKHPTYGLEKELSDILNFCLKGSSKDVVQLNLTNQQRKRIIDDYLQFIDYHLDGKQPILSIDVLSTVMSD